MTPEEIKKSATHTLNAEKKALELMIQNVDDHFVKAVQKIYSLKGRVIVSGMGKPGHIGKKIAAKFPYRRGRVLRSSCRTILTQ